MQRPIPARAAWTRRAWSWIVARRLALAAGVCASLPVVGSVARALVDRWLPYDDRGLGAVRAYDVLSTHPPLVGTYAAYSLPNRPSYSPGPLHFWLLAVPSRIGPWALVVAVGLVNVVAVVAVVALAERRGGRAFMFVTAVAVALMAGSLPTEALHDMWEPYLTILPFTLLIFLCWSLACGAQRLLPVTVLVASFVVECHVAYVAPAAGLLAVGLVGLLRTRSRERRPKATPLRRTVAVSAGVALVCWSAPLIEQATHSRGNLATLGWYAIHRGATAGSAGAWRAVVRVVGVLPWWLQTQHGSPAHFADLLPPAPLLGVASAIAILVALAALAATPRRTGNRELALAAAMALVLCACVAIVTASTPTRNGLGLTLSYTIDWGSAVGMWAWLTLVLALLTLGLPRLAVRLPRRGLSAAGLAAAAIAGVSIAATGSSDVPAAGFRPMRTVVRQLERATRGAHVVRFGPAPTWTSYEFTMAAVYALRRDGARPLVPSLTAQLGNWYAQRGIRPDLFVLVRDSAHRDGFAGRGGIRVAVTGDPLAAGGAHAVRDVVVSVSRSPGGAGASGG